MTSDSAKAFQARIDRSCPPERSVVVRYRDVPSFGMDGAQLARFRSLLMQTSQREGLRIATGIEYRGVAIDILDESTLMHTGTLKSIDGCVTTASCLLAGHARVAFATGGNTGNALTRYAVGAGIETHCFVPTANLHLLDGEIFASEGARLVAVDDPAQVKSAATRFCETQSARLVPDPAWRGQASAFIGYFVLEALLAGRRYDWLVQAISAAFAPIGIYGVLRAHADAIGGLPRFLGIQQAGNCPLYRAWRARQGEDDAAVSLDGVATELLNPVMYDRQPQGYATQAQLERVLDETNGDLDVVDRASFERWCVQDLGQGSLLAQLDRVGISIALDRGEIIEKAGLTALVGALARIANGEIEPGSRMLVCLTGGTYTPSARAVPDERIAAGSLEASWERKAG